jgi:hyaluronoglucosaminidase
MRGIIEGFYGPPWSHEQRLDLISFAGAEGFDTWVHAPKDDPYHRKLWREPYPDEELARFAALVEHAHSAGIELVYAIAPGLSIVYGSAADFSSLVDKCEQLRSVGVTSFHLLWDDLEDARGAEQAELTNRFCARFENVVVCPVDYAGIADTDYRRAFRAGLDRGIPVYWTGPAVVPDAITSDELEAARESFGGNPIVLWDNYPVNDFAPERLFLGPLRGRDPALVDGLAGYVTNPMLQAVASKLALATIADFLRDPYAYDPDVSLARAEARYGDEVRAALRR